MTTGRIAAFFDVDHTLIACNSGRKWVGHLWRAGKISVPEAIRSLLWIAEYNLNLIDYEAVAAHVVASYRGRRVSDVENEVAVWFKSEIAPTICKQARDRVADHLRQGHVTAILTSGSAFSTRPLQQELEIEHLLCTQIDVAEGLILGTHRRPACYGPGKVVCAEAFAGEHDVDLDRSYFYTDSYSDLPMLRRVSEPRIVNPDPRLRLWAMRMGWRFERWTA